MNELKNAPVCDDCDAPVSLSVDPYGAGVMLAIACPNCGVSYDTNVDQAELDPDAVRAAGRYALNGELVKLGDDDRYTDALGRYGYSAHFTGVYVCYTCGHLCDCGWEE